MNKMKYGKNYVDITVPEENILGVLYRNEVSSAPTEEDAVRLALANPIGSPRLGEIVKPGESICIIISDITRSWQRSDAYLYLLVEELLNAGAKDEDIFFISATGTHRAQTPEEHKALLGDKLYGKYKIYDHDCRDRGQLVKIGTTKRGVPVELNRRVVEAGRVILTGGIVYHFMAGWGGGRKSILPGVASYETVQANHVLALDSCPGKGRNLEVGTGRREMNVLSDDMSEAAAMLNPCFMLNVIMNSSGKIGWAVAGNWEKAYEAGTKLVDKVDLLPIGEKANLVIATAGGYPKDINLYQSSKAIFNGVEAVKPGGSLVVMSSCYEGFGNPEVEMMLTKFKNTLEREAEMRREFSISKYVGYCIADVADRCDLYLVTEMSAESLNKSSIKVCRSLDEALEKIYSKNGKALKTWLMPDGANTLPVLG